MMGDSGYMYSLLRLEILPVKVTSGSAQREGTPITHAEERFSARTMSKDIK